MKGEHSMNTNTTDLTNLLTVKDLCQILKVSKVALYQLVYRKQIPVKKRVSHCLYFDPAEIEALLNAGSRPVQSIAKE
jgi:predicted DNA-binding transcriptional regulator AlpA